MAIPLTTDDRPSLLRVSQCLYRQSHSGIYYGLLKRAGKQIRKSLKTKDRQLAERLLADLRRKVARLGKRPSSGKLTFTDLADSWLALEETKLKPSSARRVQTSLIQLKKHFGVLSVRAITTTCCEEWEKKRSAAASASTFNADRGALTRLLDYAVREGLLLDNPASIVTGRTLRKSKPVIPSREQFGHLVAQIRKADCRAEGGGNLVELLAYSGMRLNEAVSLLWSDVDSSRGVFRVTGGEVGTKNHEVRMVPLFPAMRELLERIRAETAPAPNVRVIPIKSAKKAMATASRKANLPYFMHHALRHYFVSNAIEAGIDFKAIAAWIGHKDGGVLVAQTYGHLRDTHSFEMAKRMIFTATSRQTSTEASSTNSNTK